MKQQNYWVKTIVRPGKLLYHIMKGKEFIDEHLYRHTAYAEIRELKRGDKNVA